MVETTVEAKEAVRRAHGLFGISGTVLQPDALPQPERGKGLS